VWAKNVFGLGRGYRHQHEFIIFDGLIDPDIKNESDLWQIAKDTKYKHPTQKPVALSERAIKNSTKPNNIVLDYFGGSGSTLIGCEKTGRKARVMELDPIYCDVIVKRWENFTGKKAVLSEL
jgi:DNA modification methylase